MLRPLGGATREFLAQIRPILLDGAWTTTAHEVASINPADGTLIGRYWAGGLPEAQAAVAAARSAFDRGVWHGLPPAASGGPDRARCPDSG